MMSKATSCQLVILLCKTKSINLFITDSEVNKPRKHKSPSVKKRDLARLEQWKKRWQSADSSLQSVTPDQQQLIDGTSGDNKQKSSISAAAVKAPRKENSSQKELLLASIQKLKELSQTEMANQPCAFPPKPMLMHSLDNVLHVSCFHCNQAEKQVKGGLKLCTRCRGASYCSKECQTKDWKVHRPICSPAKTNMIEKITTSLQQELNILGAAD